MHKFIMLPIRDIDVVAISIDKNSSEGSVLTGYNPVFDENRIFSGNAVNGILPDVAMVNILAVPSSGDIIPLYTGDGASGQRGFNNEVLAIVEKVLQAINMDGTHMFDNTPEFKEDISKRFSNGELQGIHFKSALYSVLLKLVRFYRTDTSGKILTPLFYDNIYNEIFTLNIREINPFTASTYEIVQGAAFFSPSSAHEAYAPVASSRPDIHGRIHADILNNLEGTPLATMVAQTQNMQFEISKQGIFIDERLYFIPHNVIFTPEDFESSERLLSKTATIVIYDEFGNELNLMDRNDDALQGELPQSLFDGSINMFSTINIEQSIGHYFGDNATTTLYSLIQYNGNSFLTKHDLVALLGSAVGYPGGKLPTLFSDVNQNVS